VSSVKHSGATRPVAIEDDAAGAERKPSGVRRVLHIVGAVVVVLVLPALVIGAFVGELGVSAMFTGVLLGAVGAKLGGTHRMLYVAPALGVAGGLGAYTAYDWWWVALLAAAGVIAGAGIRFGWFAALLMVPFAATFVTPVSTVTDAVIYGVILAIASLYGVVLARRFGAPRIVDGDHLAPRVAAGVGAGCRTSEATGSRDGAGERVRCIHHVKRAQPSFGGRGSSTVRHVDRPGEVKSAARKSWIEDVGAGICAIVTKRERSGRSTNGVAGKDKVDV